LLAWRVDDADEGIELRPAGLEVGLAIGDDRDRRLRTGRLGGVVFRDQFAG
jgi:hypothetical protein